MNPNAIRPRVISTALRIHLDRLYGSKGLNSEARAYIEACIGGGLHQRGLSAGGPPYKFPPSRHSYEMQDRDIYIVGNAVAQAPRGMPMQYVYVRMLALHYSMDAQSSAGEPPHQILIALGSRPSLWQFRYWARQLSTERSQLRLVR